jgi:hypothetical protein
MYMQVYILLLRHINTRRRGRYGRNRAQTTRHVVPGSMFFFFSFFFLLLTFSRIYSFTYYYDTLRRDGGEGIAGALG